MQPEKGNPTIQVDAQTVCDGFRSVGAVDGDTVIYHGSLSSMGTVVNGPDTVIDGARLAVGPTGTVAMPTLWFHDADPPVDPNDFNIDTSESYVGALSEAFRKHPDSVRSDHFSHSVSAIGARALELTENHGGGGLRHTPWSPKAFADVSPWGRLIEWNALYCFIGVTFRVLTLKHYMEAIIVDEILQQTSDAKKAEATDKLSHIGYRGIWPYFNSEDLQARLTEMGLVKHGKIGSATIRAIRAQELIENGLPMLRNHPEAWFNEEFMQWREQTLG